MDAKLLVWHALSWLLMAMVVVAAGVVPGLMLTEWTGLTSTGLIQPTFWGFTLALGTGVAIFVLLLGMALNMALYQIESEVPE